jgi:hypothetical protein
MALPFQGRGAAVGIGQETTYGTAVSRTNWRQTIRSSAYRKVTRNYRKDLVGVAGAITHRATTPGVIEMGGSFEHVMTYEGMGMHIKNAMGAAASTGSGPYVHTYTLGALPPGMTIEFIESGDSGNVAEVVEGAKFSRMAMNWSSPSEEATISFDFLGEDAGAYTTAGSPSYAAGGLDMVGHQLGALTWNSNSHDLVSLEMVVDNKLASRFKLGSRLTKEPARTDFAEVTWRAEIEWEDGNALTDFRAEVQGDVVVTSTGTGNHAATFTLQNAQLWDAPKPVDGAGPGRLRLEWRGLSDGTDKGFKIAITNNDSSATAP